MLEIYWGCLVGGLLFGLISLLLGDVLGNVFDGMMDAISVDGFDFLHPMAMVGGITVFGAAGLMLTKYTSLGPTGSAITAAGIALLFAVVVFFIYIKPMKKTESSMGFSIKELVGKRGEVTIPIPANGCGEVVVKMGAQHTYQIAAAHDNQSIPTGTDVIIVDVEDGTLMVTVLEA